MIRVTTFCGKRIIHDCIQSSSYHTRNPADTINRGANNTAGDFTMKCYVVYKSEEWHRLKMLGWITWEVNPSEEGCEWATMFISAP